MGDRRVFRSGDVVTYDPDPTRHDPRWCREGWAIANHDGNAHDTYWQSGGDAHRLTDEEAAGAVVVFNMAEYDELDRYGRGVPTKWATYGPDDRERVPSQHGLQARWFIRKGAEPDHRNMVNNARAALREVEEEARLVIGRVGYRAEEYGLALAAARAAGVQV